MSDKLSVDDIEALLPQTQCEECGYPGCRPYAEAMLAGQAKLDACPPGGVETLTQLGTVFKQDVSELLASMKTRSRAPSVANIIEQDCIGCTKCIQACPVDAILGTSKQMHTVIADECTGCGLCVEPCPVDCIVMHDLPEPRYDKTLAKRRYQHRLVRLERDKRERREQHDKARQLHQSEELQQQRALRREYIQQAMARSKQNKPIGQQHERD